MEQQRPAEEDSKISQESRGPADGHLSGADPEALLDWFRWLRHATLAMGAFFLLLFAARRSPASLIIGGGLLGLLYPTIRFGASSIRRGQLGRGLAYGSVGIWLTAIGIATRGTITLSIAVALAFLPVIIAIPYLSRRKLQRLAIAGFAAAGICAATAAAGPLISSTLSDQALAIMAVPILLLIVGLAMFALWHVSSRLRESLNETQSGNKALRESEQLLERKVEERTVELGRKNEEIEVALAEVSDIDEIARIANTTLDVGRVVEVALGAIQKIFPSDLTALGLLDESREFLVFGYSAGPGWTPEAIERVGELDVPVSEESSFAHVVRNDRPFFIKEIGPEAVAVMSDTDRAIFETIPAKSLLICPLEVEGEPIGIIVFANSREAVALERPGIERIRRYVRPLAASIRNARLFEESNRALEEISDTQEIARTANATLDTRQVMQVVLAAEKVLPFDGMSIGLLDEGREQLVMQKPMGSGLDPHALSDLAELRIPMAETESAFTHVVRNNQPFFLVDVRPEVVAAMSPSDRRMYEAYEPTSILICPLEFEDAVVGVILLINKRQVLDLERSDLDRIRRYLTPVATAIRNARLFEEAKSARGAAVEANQAKSQFLANMSHEFRTPLTAIIGYAEMLKEEVGDRLDDYQEDLDQILSSSGYLLELISGVLDLSKIEAGKMDVYLDRSEVADLVKSVAETLQPLIQQKSNTLVLGELDGLGHMLTDVTKVRQTLFNLLSNASKFTERGEIRLEVERTTLNGVDWIVFRVIDSGIGMTQEQCARVFEVFAQADASTTKQFGGTGLGLPIAKRFCELLGGSIEVSSEPGRGTSFTVSLPVEASLDDSAEETTVEAPVAALGARCALVVDDDPAARDLIGRALARQGFGVLTAAGGLEALRLARERRPDLITLDVVMPDMDGWTVLGELKADPELADTPVVMLSIDEDQNRGYALGASEYLTKPIDRERLAAVLGKYGGDGQGLQALVVDDDPKIRELLRRGLKRAGWGVAVAENGRIALERVAEAVPDLILLDLMMPEMDGFEFLEALRRHEAWREIPTVVVTAKELTAEDRDRLNGGVTRILQKSSRGAEELLDKVRSLVGARGGAQDS